MKRPIPFINRCLALPATCYARVLPTPVTAPRLIAFNAPLATELGISAEGASPATLAGIFSGNTVPEGAASVALAYAGHQFGGFSPQLGDGRAILMGDVVDIHGQARDLQWKGTGRTPFSRGGDGRAALGPVLREYLLSEAMHALGVPTTRALAAVTTGEQVLRDAALPGGIVTRVAASHLRIGTFQYFAARRDFLVPALQALGLEVPVLPDGAFYVWADASRHCRSSWDFAFKLMDRAHVAMTPGRDFGPSLAETHLRISYASSLAQLQEAVRRLQRHLQPHRGA